MMVAVRERRASVREGSLAGVRFRAVAGVWPDELGRFGDDGAGCRVSREAVL